MEKALLSKSTFIKGWQCLKALYLYKNRYFLRDPLAPEQRIKFVRGHNIGDLARELFPGGINLAPKAPSQNSKAVEATRQAIMDGAEIIYEAAFQAEQVIVFLDILVKREGKWSAYEVKSSRGISETYIMDASLQYHVITASGLDLEDFYLVHVNKDYVMEDDLNLRELFEFRNVNEEVKANNAFVRELILKEKETIQMAHSPAIKIGTWCNYPYPCEFRGHCWKNVPQKSVFNIPSFDEEMKFSIYYNGNADIAGLSKLQGISPIQQAQVTSLSAGVPYVDKEKLRAFLPETGENFTFLHFSIFRPALPLFRHTRPYQPLPFMFSLKTIVDGAEKEDFFLAGQDKMTSEAFFGKLDELLQKDSRILIYNQTADLQVLKEYYPEKQLFLDNILKNSTDLAEPFINSYVYIPEMKGNHELASLVGIFPEVKVEATSSLNEILAADLYLKIQDQPDDNLVRKNSDKLKEYSSGSLKLIQKMLEKFRQLAL